ncbi:MAG: hypothetical protein HY823_02510 [Acidobacteria bacterium]|nr:hypothetical protein [Acidobacteriota bacterium]
MHKKSLVLGALLACCACQGPRTLEARIHGRAVATLAATATRRGDHWIVELPLPAGAWRAETEESQAMEVVPGSPRGTLRWSVSPERWNHRDKPLHLKLIPETGPPLELDLKYPYAPSAAERVFTFVFTVLRPLR